MIVEIDDASIARSGAGRGRARYWRGFLTGWAAARPKVIGFDLLFTEPQPEPLKAEVGEIEAAMAPLLQSLDPADKRRLAEILSGFLRSSDPDAILAEAIRRDGKVILPFTPDLLPKARNSTASLPVDLTRATMTGCAAAIQIICRWPSQCICRWRRWLGTRGSRM